MNKITTRPTRHVLRRWLLAGLLACLLATGSFYAPTLTPTAYACQSAGGGGC